MVEVSREHYLVHAGLKADAELQLIHERHPRATSAGALDVAREAFLEAADGSAERAAAGKLLEWQIETQVGRTLAELDERTLAAEARTVVRLPDGREIPYQRASIDMANAVDRDERLAIDDARAAAVAREIAPLRRERLTRERELVEAMEIGDSYIAVFEATSGVSLATLAAQCEALLADTQPMWDDVLPTFLRRAGVPRGDARRADALAVMRATAYDDAFAARDLEPAVRRQLAEAHLSADAHGRIHLDLGEREGKRGRTFCCPVRVPDEVYLVTRPTGGVQDWRSFLHELGHALHFANMSAALPFEDRYLGDNSVTECFAMLFDHLLHDPGWLARYSALPPHRMRDFLTQMAFEELQFLRRYAAKLLYELELYGSDTAWSSLPERFVERMTAATGFQYHAADAFVDVDPRFYAARYLRAWQLQGALAEHLRNRFDEDWFRNPEGGAYLVGQLMAEGQHLDATGLLARETGDALSFGPVVRAVEQRLA